MPCIRPHLSTQGAGLCVRIFTEGASGPLAAAGVPARARAGTSALTRYAGYGLTPARPPRTSPSSATPGRLCKAVVFHAAMERNAPPRRRRQADATPGRLCKACVFHATAKRNAPPQRRQKQTLPPVAFVRQSSPTRQWSVMRRRSGAKNRRYPRAPL